MRTWILSIVLCGLFPFYGIASERDTSELEKLQNDTIEKKRTLLNRLLDYFAKSDDPDSTKNFDFGLICGSHYSSDVGLGLGIVASGLYSADRRDMLLPKSNVSIYSDVTTEAFLLLGVRGNHIFPRKRYRMDYRLYIYTFPTYFWGIGYFHSRLNGGDVPWPMLSAVGGDSRMRGYYEGRYRDKNIIEAQLELRQHIWHRNGAVCWIGAANVFLRWSALRGRKTLYNAGIGYR